MRSVITLRWMFCGALLAGLLPAIPAHAVDLPPSNTTAFVQTSGPEASLATGDFYTSTSGGNSAVGHEFQIYVPCTWPAGLSLTFALFDPEVMEPDPASGILADDEIRDNSTPPAETTDTSYADSTSFTLTTAGGAVYSQTYMPNSGSNQRWVELATLTPGDAASGCGEYTLTTKTEKNDDNAWVLRLGHDPDCAGGACGGISSAASALLSNGNLVDDPDGVVGSGDELVLGMLHTSFQQYPDASAAPTDLSCQDFYTFVGLGLPSVTFNNFDLDRDVMGRESVSYYPPVGSSYPSEIVGSVSKNMLWNNPPSPDTIGGVPQRGGDTFTIGAQDVGWWRMRVCVEYPSATAFKNQYVVEASSGVLFFNQPPTPVITLAKSDGVTQALRGQQLTYALNFANTSDSTATPGSAHHVELVDTLPDGLTYLGCAIDAPFSGTCALSGQQVRFSLNEPIMAGQRGSVHVVAQVDADAPQQLENIAQMSYDDSIGNPYPPITTTDLDRVPAAGPPTAISLASLAATRAGGAVTLAWRTTAEQDTVGFYVLRGTTSAGAARISPLVAAKGGQGGSYAWQDSAPLDGERYWLEEITAAGAGQRYGPVAASGPAAAPSRTYIPLVAR